MHGFDYNKFKLSGRNTVSKKIYSVYDNKGKLHVDCSECTRGANGSDPDKCSCGWRYKRGNMGGCFMGNLLPHINLAEVKRLS